MQVRDAVEADAERLGVLADVSTAAAVELIHDRTVRVAVEETDDAGAGPDGDGAERRATSESGAVVAFVAYDARPEVVEVTRLCGDPEAFERLLEEPAAFARAEGMVVETLVPATPGETRTALERFGFREVGAGPRFAGDETRRYRWGPD